MTIIICMRKESNATYSFVKGRLQIQHNLTDDQFFWDIDYGIIDVTVAMDVPFVFSASRKLQSYFCHGLWRALSPYFVFYIRYIQTVCYYEDLQTSARLIQESFVRFIVCKLPHESELRLIVRQNICK